MTLSASMADNDTVKVQITYGPVTVQVVEAYSHVESFYSQLGQLIANRKGEQNA